MGSYRAFYLLPLAAGVLTSVQSGANGTLERSLRSPALVTLVSLGVGIATLVGVSLLRDRLGPPDAASAPWWAWSGGVLGAVVVIAQPVAAPRLGAATFIGMLVTASVGASLTLDHFGLVGFARRTASRGRIAGAGLMVAGVRLVATL